MLQRLLSCITVLFLLGCQSPQSDSLSAGEVSPSLEIRVSVGAEYGDSCYVFGSIRDACVLQDGRILVLDGITCRISCYDPDGEFLERVGGSGEGPGEYIRPFCMTALADGRVVLSDPGLTRMTFLSSDLSVDTIISGFIPWSPERVSPAADGSYTGSYRIFDRENSMYGKLIALWSDSPVQDMEYYNRLAPFNRERLRESTEECEVVFTSDFQGNVYYSPYSYQEFSVVAMDRSGEVLYTIEEDREPIARPIEDIERERSEMQEQLRNEGAPPEMQWDPSEYRAMVPLRGMGVDSEGRLWVRDGREESPVFDVYSLGEHMFRTALDCEELQGLDLRVKVHENGIVAWEPDPEIFPVLYVLEVEQ